MAASGSAGQPGAGPEATGGGGLLGVRVTQRPLLASLVEGTFVDAVDGSVGDALGCSGDAPVAALAGAELSAGARVHPTIPSRATRTAG